jgi:hypothetical protein
VITFWVNQAGRFGIEQYIATRAHHLAGRFEVRCYEELTPELTVGTGGHIFSALDQLSPSGHRAVVALHGQLAASLAPGRILNDPSRVPGRSVLLHRLLEAGVNRFAVHHATRAEAVRRFPVFVREDARHNGPLTGLLPDAAALARALRRLRLRGHRLPELLIVEFCDVADSEGMIRTGSAFRVGEAIVPAHMLRGRAWMLKWSESDHGEEAMEEHRQYVYTNPHLAWVRRVFDLAQIEYGRLDYGVRGEVLQAWEINTNPTLGPSRGPVQPYAPPIEALLVQARTVHHDALRAAFQALDVGLDSERLTLRLDPVLLTGMRSEARQAARRRAVFHALHRITSLPVVGRLLQAGYGRLVPPR